MLSCFQGSTNTIFQHILKFFCKKNSTVLDITYGRGFSWQNPKEGFPNYNVIKVDRRKLADDVILLDFNKYIEKKESESIDCVYFDPPYYFEEKISKFDIDGQMLNDKEEVFWTEKEFEESLNTLQEHIPRILKDKGIFIVKIMDGYVAKEYSPNAFKIFEKMKKVMNPKGTFICPIQKKDTIMKFIRPNHIYYMVFQKKDFKEHD